MRNYGNLRKKIPYTFWAMMLGTLAITGVGIPLLHIGHLPPIGFAGFLSKDAIIESAYAGGGPGLYACTQAPSRASAQTVRCWLRGGHGTVDRHSIRYFPHYSQ